MRCTVPLDRISKRLSRELKKKEELTSPRRRGDEDEDPGDIESAPCSLALGAGSTVTVCDVGALGSTRPFAGVSAARPFRLLQFLAVVRQSDG